jgi:hypothetical protein
VRSIPAIFYFKTVGTQNGVQSKSVMTSHLTSIIKANIMGKKINIKPAYDTNL